MGRYMIRLVAFDLVLRFVRRGMMRISFIVKVRSMYLDYCPRHHTGLGVPAYFIADIEFSLQALSFGHYGLVTVIRQGGNRVCYSQRV